MRRRILWWSWRYWWWDYDYDNSDRDNNGYGYYYYYYYSHNCAGTYNYVHETRKFSRACKVTAILWLQFALLARGCVQCPKWLLSVVAWCRNFPVRRSGILWIILSWFQFPLSLLISLLFLYSTYALLTLRSLCIWNYHYHYYYCCFCWRRFLICQ